eukprot:6491724-Amphidinium_carterae.1
MNAGTWSTTLSTIPHKVSAIKGKKNKVKQKKGTGGAWRAYVKMHGQGLRQRPSLNLFAAAYRELKRQGGAEYDALLRMGKTATEVGKYSSKRKRSCFGPTFHEMLKHTRLRGVRTFAEQHRHLHPHELSVALVEHVVLLGKDLGEAVSFAAAVERQMQQLQKAKATETKA